MLAYCDGDPQGFRSVYEYSSGRVYSYIRSKIANRSHGDEIFQTVYLKVHRSRHLYQPKTPVMGWIYTIAKNTITDYYRRQALEEKRATLADPEEGLPGSVNEGISESLGSVVSGLSARQRAVLVDRFVHDRSFDDIATKLKTTPGNIRQLVSRSIRLIRQRLGRKETR